ncbi:DUF2946 domain-containing protein [Burkholderia gladioli]|uniref:DUF2946 domain-containing protein n=1 Tax=Burkholderia gladioli TaxID=28095 RepID=UPI00163F7D87|nr:DUF2946 domain-containing protein [Burkholderia gladioli]MBJ9663851.1 DUF2946 domain-containing protein [Burkholderia gladioli]MBU9215797.1 DUF2946 domain-containing protein [Burkholderia gladioli]MDN7721677.1 DUF2946 domain-containing protein [Burkholderia gladioli]
MRRRSRTRFTAWLGLLAMWLIVLAPLVSQLLAAHRANDPTVVAICSTAHAPSQSMAMSMPMPADSAMQMDHTDPLAACGYCDLLADHLVLPSLPPAPLVLVMLVALAAAPVLSTRFTPLGAFPSGRPRAPPRLS